MRIEQDSIYVSLQTPDMESIHQREMLVVVNAAWVFRITETPWWRPGEEEEQQDFKRPVNL